MGTEVATTAGAASSTWEPRGSPSPGGDAGLPPPQPVLSLGGRLIHALCCSNCDLNAACGSNQLGLHLPLWMLLWGSCQKTAKPFASEANLLPHPGSPKGRASLYLTTGVVS